MFEQRQVRADAGRVRHVRSRWDRLRGLPHRLRAVRTDLPPLLR